MTTTKAKPDTQPADKTANANQVIAGLTNDLAAVRINLAESHDRVQSAQAELASMLAMQRGATKHRVPLEQAVFKEKRVEQEAQEALSRHLGQETESVFSDRLFEAGEGARLAQEALAAFDKQYIAKERESELRAELKKAQEAVNALQRRQLQLTHELDQALAARRVIALSRVLHAYQDLFDVLEVDGPALARLRIDDGEEYYRLIPELTIYEDALFSMIDAGPDGNEPRPYLHERQQSIRKRLARVRKLAE